MTQVYAWQQAAPVSQVIDVPLTVPLTKPIGAENATMLKMQVQGGAVRVRTTDPTDANAADEGWIVFEFGTIEISYHDFEAFRASVYSGTPRLYGVWQ